MRHRGRGRPLPLRSGAAAGLRRPLVAALVAGLAALAAAASATAAPGDISTVAGNGTNTSAGDGGPATSAGIGDVEGVYSSAGGFHLVEGAGNRARYVDSAGVISTVAGGGTADPGDGGAATAALLGHPEQVIRDRYGNVYFSEGNRVRRVSTLGIITTVAGTGTAGFSGDGGAATAAQLARPHGLALDIDGNLYIGDCDNYRVRRVGPGAMGVITTVAGTGTQGYAGDAGPATLAQINCPVDVAIDGSGRLFIADNGNHVVRMVSTGGTITTFAGTGTAGHSGDGGPALSAQINGPQGLDVDGAQSLYIAGSGSHVIRKVDSAGEISTVAGTPASSGFSGDGGPATAARLNGPREVSFDYPTGDLYIADRFNHRVRRVQALGVPYVPPTVTIDSAPASPGIDRTPTWAFSVGSSEQFSVECRLTRGAAIVSDWAACSSPQTYDLSAEPDGSYAFDARAVTISGVGTPTSSSYAFETFDHFELDPIGDQLSDRQFNVTVRAKTASGLTDTAFAGTVALSVNSGSIEPATSGAFVNGVRTEPVTITGPYTSSQTITVTGGSPARTGTSNPFALYNWSFYFKKTQANTGSSCLASTRRRDMEIGYTGQDPEETFARTGPGTETLNFCSPALGFSGTFPPASTTAYAYVHNTHASSCTISATLSKNGTAILGSTSRSIPPQIGVTRFTWTITTSSSTTIASSDRMNVRFEMEPASACDETHIHYGGTTYRSRLTPFAGESPAPTITATPGTTGSDRTPTWSFSGEAGASFECRLEDGAGAAITGLDWSVCSSPRTYDLTGLPDGPYVFAVRQTVGGTTSPPARSDYLLDTIAPPPPTIDSSPPSPGSATAVSWSFSGEPGGAFECRLRKGAAVISGYAPCSGSQGYTLADGDGIYTFEVRQTDAAGNTGPEAARDYTLDTLAPVAPTIVSAPQSPGSDGSPEWSFIGESGALIECRLTRGAAVVSDWSGCLSPQQYDLSAEPDGAYVFHVRQRDLAGNISPTATSGYDLDRAVPSAPTLGAGPGATGSDDTPTWAFSGEVGASFECRLQDGAGAAVAGFDWGACSSPHTFDLSAEPDGSYVFAVRQTDAAGNTSPAATSGYVLDRSAPAAPTITGSPGPSGSATNPVWSFDAEAGASLQCRLDRGATVVSDWSACTSPYGADLSGEPDGLYTFSVRAVDAAGNVGAAASDDYDLDRVAPAAPTITDTPGAVGNDPTPSWSFDGEPGALLECRLERGATVVADWQLCVSPAGYDLTGSPDGDHRFLVRAVDMAGNVGASAQSDYELDRTPPAAPTIDSGPGPVGSSRTPAWTFSGETGATHECRLTRDGVPVADWAPCAGAAAYDLAGQPDGTYAFAVRGRDEAGNTGPESGSSYRLDTIGADVTIESGPGPAGNAASPSWSFAGEAGTRFECRLERDGAPVFDWSSCASPRAYDLSSEPDGRYTFSVRSFDEVDNLGPAVSYDYELDRVAPPAPEFTLAPPALANDPSPRWEFVAEDGATVECALERDGVALLDFEPCADARGYDLADDGDYAIAVRATDRAGNAGPVARSPYSFDATAPDAPRITSGPGPRGERLRVAWTFTGEAGAAFQCRLQRGPAILEPWNACTSPFGFDLDRESAGEHTFRVRARDGAGNLGPATSSDYELLEGEDAPPREDARSRDDRDPSPREERSNSPAAAPAPAGGGSPPAGPEPSGPAPTARDASTRVESDRAPAPGVSGDRRSPRRGPGIPLEDGAGAGGLGAGPPAARPGGDRESLGERALDTLAAGARWVGRNLDKTGFPLLLLFVVLGYLVVQNRLDSRDPKLALAPLHADRDLEFVPPASLRTGLVPNPPPEPIR